MCQSADSRGVAASAVTLLTFAPSVRETGGDGRVGPGQSSCTRAARTLEEAGWLCARVRTSSVVWDGDRTSTVRLTLRVRCLRRASRSVATSVGSVSQKEITSPAVFPTKRALFGLISRGVELLLLSRMGRRSGTGSSCRVLEATRHLGARHLRGHPGSSHRAEKAPPGAPRERRILASPSQTWQARPVLAGTCRSTAMLYETTLLYCCFLSFW